MRVRILLGAPKILEVIYVPINAFDDYVELDLSPQNIRRIYRYLLMQNFTPAEAGNLIAKLLGLNVTEKSWTVKQLVAIEFLKALNETFPL